MTSSMYVLSTVCVVTCSWVADGLDAGLQFFGDHGRVDAAAELIDGGHEVVDQTGELPASRHGGLLHVLPGPGGPSVAPGWRSLRQPGLAAVRGRRAARRGLSRGCNDGRG